MTRFAASSLLLLALALLLGAPRAAQAAEGYDNCTGYITSIPAVISTQGTWCLKQDVQTAMTSGDAITIATNNVTIDCNDFKVGGLAGGVGTLALGIYAQDHQNATVRHCNIRGFYVGIYFPDTASSGHVIEDNRFDGNTYVGIYVFGDGSVVRRNRVFETGATTQKANAFGIVSVYSTDVRDNTVSGVTATSGGNGSAIGIYTNSNSGGRIIGNGVRGLIKAGTGSTYGIYNLASARLTMRKNDVVGDASTGSYGLLCADSNSSARDNTVSQFVGSLLNCSNDGGNKIHP